MIGVCRKWLRSLGLSVWEALSSRGFWMLFALVLVAHDLPLAVRMAVVVAGAALLTLGVILYAVLWWMERHDERA